MMPNAIGRSSGGGASMRIPASGLPGAVCVVACDPYFSIVWANDAFFDLVACTRTEMALRFDNRLSACWSKEAVDQLASVERLPEGEPLRFRHGETTERGVRTFTTEAMATEVDGQRVMCCVSFDSTREEALTGEIQQFMTMNSCIVETASLEVFAFDSVTRTARLIAATDVLGKLSVPGSIVPNFPEECIRHGLVHPDDATSFLNAMNATLYDGARATCDLRLGGPAPHTGRWRWYRLTVSGCSNSFVPGGATGGGVLMDITEHKELAMAYLNDMQFFHALLGEAAAYAEVDVTDDKGLRTGGLWNLYNELLDTMSFSQIATTFINRVVHVDDRAHYLDLMRCENFVESLESGIDRLGCEFRRITEQNKMAWMELTVHLMKDPVTDHVVALLSIKDIDKRKRQELQLQSSSERDPLTQVLNKRATEDAIRARMSRLEPSNASALLILDIDDFKTINDRWGHKAGDDALLRFTHAIRCSIGREDVLGRFGGDEFILFVTNAFDEEHVEKLLVEVFDRLSDSADLPLTCSVGIAMVMGGLSYGEAFARADEALYEAKSAGKATFRFYGAGKLAGEVAAAGEKAEGPDPSGVGTDRKRCVVCRDGVCDDILSVSPSVDDGFERDSHAAHDGLLTSPIEEDDLLPFADFLSDEGDIAYLVDPDTFTLICGNKSFYHRIGETPATCFGMRCYEAMQRRETPCPFCGKANWTSDKFFLWRNYNRALDQEFIIKNKLVTWQGREVLLAIAVDISNNKSIVDSLDNGMAENQYLLGGVQQVNAARSVDDVVERALETLGGFYRAERVLFWTREAECAPYKCTMAWSDGPGALMPAVPDDRSLDSWLTANVGRQPVMVESPGAAMRLSFSMYRYLEDNGIENVQWIEVRDGMHEKRFPDYLSVENMTANLQNVAFLESFSVFVATELGKRRMLEDLLHASSHDDLTGLLNRECYESRVASLDTDALKSVGVVSANVNDMKYINGSKGFAAGNYYLQQFASMLEDCFATESIFRLNGDEFAVVSTGLDREELERRVGNLRAMVRLNGLFTVALGYSWDDVEKDFGALTEQAVLAMEADKKRYHDEASDREGDESRREALRGVLAAIEDGRFTVFLQPKEDIANHAVSGAEALVRYTDPENGVVSPMRFVPALEDSGLIRHIDLFVFDQVCRMQERWKREGRAIPISLNFSRRTLIESDIAVTVAGIAERYDIDRGLVEIEITESFATMGKGMLFQAANGLTNRGFSLALDDFGTKYTDLSIMSSIPFNVIKLDKSLIGELVEDGTKRIVLKHIIRMCRELKVDVIAEGVETEEQESILRGLGCRYAQGYLYGRPIPLDVFEREFLGLKPHND